MRMSFGCALGRSKMSKTLVGSFSNLKLMWLFWRPYIGNQICCSTVQSFLEFLCTNQLWVFSVHFKNGGTGNRPVPERFMDSFWSVRTAQADDPCISNRKRDFHPNKTLKQLELKNADLSKPPSSARLNLCRNAVLNVATVNACIATNLSNYKQIERSLKLNCLRLLRRSNLAMCHPKLSWALPKDI